MTRRGSSNGTDIFSCQRIAVKEYMQKGGDPIQDEQINKRWSPGERGKQERESIGFIGNVGAGNAELEER